MSATSMNDTSSLHLGPASLAGALATCAFVALTPLEASAAPCSMLKAPVVYVAGTGSKVIGKLQHSCNTDAKQNWQQVSFDATSALSRYAGQTVTLIFNARTSSSFTVTTAFFVDDVAVRAQ